MPVFRYKILTPDGKSQSGTREAGTGEEMLAALNSEGLYVTEIFPVTGDEAAAGPRFFPGWLSGRRNKEVTVATQQLATLIKTGIPLSRALGIVAEQAENVQMGNVFRDLRERIGKGETLADAMTAHPAFFDDLYVNMVRAAEASGEMDRVLAMLAKFTGEKNALRNKVLSALTYPIFLAVMGTGVVVFLLTFVVNKISVVLIRQGKVLPLPTRVMLGVSDFIGGWWWAIVLAVLAAVLAVSLIKRTKGGKYFLDSLIIRMPIIGPIVRKQAIVRFAMTFQSLLGSGLSVTDSLVILKRIMQNSLMREALETVYERIIEGADIATPIRKTGMFPPMVGHMVAVGEESGQMEEVLSTISGAYREEVETSLTRLTALVEPIMIVVLAALVGLIVMAVMLPIMEVSSI